MLNRILLISLLAFPFSGHAESFIDKAKGIFDMAMCMQKSTQTMCIYEKLVASSPNAAIKKDGIIMGQSGMYTLSVPNSNWKKLWPRQKRTEDLVVMDQSGHAFVQVDWVADSTASYEAAAKEPLQDLADKLNTEPTPVALEVWPFETDGIFYEICYNTNKETVECLYSAAANIPGGMVKIFSLTAAEDQLVEDIVYLVMSLDIPATEKTN